MTGRTRRISSSALDLLEAGPRRLAADVEDVGALRLETQPLRDRRLDVRAQAVAREGVGRHVDDAHDEGARAPDERRACRL